MMDHIQQDYGKQYEDCKEAEPQVCSRHSFNELPCIECREEAKLRKTREAAEANRANHFKRQPKPVVRQLPRGMRGR